MLSKNILLYFILLFTSLLFLSNDAYSSHYRAGEITYTWISGRTYEITVNTYTDPTSPANINTISIVLVWGDNSSESVPRQGGQIAYPNAPYVVKNVYVARHTYQSDGDFLINMTDQNRVDGIININGGNTREIAFYIETLLHIDQFIGINRSPVLHLPPIDEGCGGFIYVHNPGANDPDGDSLYYDLITPKKAIGVNVDNYLDPCSPNHCFTINHQTGQIVWNVPPINGGSTPFIYNIAIQITEFRGKIMVGYIERDMQIRIENCVNSPPVIAPMLNYCVDAGKLIKFDVTATDPNAYNGIGQSVTLQGYGAPFDASEHLATITPTTRNGDIFYATVSWLTACSNIHHDPVPLYIKAIDNYAIPGTDIKQSNITIIGPAPFGVSLKQVGNGFRISWNKDICGLASQYKIYKRTDSSHWTPPPCHRGIEDSLFSLIGTNNVLNNPNDTTFYDNNNGDGLSPLIRYCYRIVAVYPPRDASGTVIYSKTSDSRASDEVCAEIIRSKPIITNVSVRNTSIDKGSIYLHWLKPFTLDTIIYPPPYHLVFNRSTSFNGSYIPFDSFSYSSFGSITDSSFIDTFLNTSGNQYFYKIEFKRAAVPADSQFIDVSPSASSVKAAIYSTDRTNILSWKYQVPWRNKQFIIYRKNNLQDSFDSIGISISNSFSDTGLYNGTNYCYLVKSIGEYSQLFSNPLENFSQFICGTPVDTIRPCAPVLTLTPPCNSFNDFKNILKWIPKGDCSGDVIYYKIYYKRLTTDQFTLLGVVGKDTLQYNDSRAELKSSIAGCYVVTGVDSFNNESFFTNEICTDNCPEYRLPNVFTPNRDGWNDILHPFPYRFVDKIEINIFDRWGLPVFKTTNLDINWDGTDQDSKADCTDGVYFYICDIYEIFLEGVKKRTIRGTIQILR